MSNLPQAQEFIDHVSLKKYLAKVESSGCDNIEWQVGLHYAMRSGIRRCLGNTDTWMRQYSIPGPVSSNDVSVKYPSLFRSFLYLGYPKKWYNSDSDTLYAGFRKDFCNYDKYVSTMLPLVYALKSQLGGVPYKVRDKPGVDDPTIYSINFGIHGDFRLSKTLANAGYYFGSNHLPDAIASKFHLQQNEYYIRLKEIVNEHDNKCMRESMDDVDGDLIASKLLMLLFTSVSCVNISSNSLRAAGLNDDDINGDPIQQFKSHITDFQRIFRDGISLKFVFPFFEYLFVNNLDISDGICRLDGFTLSVFLSNHRANLDEWKYDGGWEEYLAFVKYLDHMNRNNMPNEIEYDQNHNPSHPEIRELGMYMLCKDVFVPGYDDIFIHILFSI